MPSLRPVVRRARSALENAAAAAFEAGRRHSRAAPLARIRSEGTLVMGRWSYGTPIVHAFRGDTGKVSVGSFVSIADDVEIFVGGEHPVTWVSTYPLRERFGMPGALRDGLPRSKGDVHIGNDVWIGHGASILSGVSIGDGAVVGANAMVTRDVRAYAIVAGNPAREIRRRFPDEVVAQLEAAAWWDWPEADIRAAVGFLSSDRIEEFLRYAAGRQPSTDERARPG